MEKAQGCRLRAVDRRNFPGLAVIGVAAAFAVVSPLVAHAGDAQQALVWLEGQQRADGSWCSVDERTCVGYTAEVLEAGTAGSGQWAVGSSVVARAQSYFENVVAHDSGALARKLAVGRMAGYVRSDDFDKLKSLVTPEGGVAGWEFFAAPDMYRTIQALKFFAGYDPVLAARAAAYLVSTQHPDGSFGIARDVGTTAQAVMALALAQSYVNVGPAITAGLDFIVSQANADGSIGSCPHPDPLPEGEGPTSGDCTRDTAWGVLAVQTIAGDINNVVPMGAAYLTSQLDAQSSLRQDPVLTALYIRIAGQDRPDLLVSPRGISVSPAVAETGHPVDVAVEVKNAGFADASSFAANIFYGDSPVATPQVVPALAAGAVTTATFRLDDPGEAGVYSFSAKVDVANAVDEANEQNNVTLFTLKVGTRDLSVVPSQVGPVPLRPYPDRPFNLFATVRSLGDLASSNVRVALYDDDPDGGGTLVEEQVVPSIPVGGSATASYSLTSPTANKTYCVTVNRAGELRESNTQNNKACITVNIASQPDLTFATPRIIVPNSAVTTGDLVPLKVLLTNIGTASASNVTVRFYADAPRTGTPVGTDLVAPSVAPMQMVELSGPVFDTTGRVGAVTLYAVADPDDAIVEADEYNNLASVTLEVSGRPDLAISADDIHVSPESPQEGRRGQGKHSHHARAFSITTR